MAGNGIRLGLIGAGRWGRNYIKTIAEINGLRLARLASRNPESRSLVDEECTVSSDWKEVSEARDIDGVIVATPPALHAEMTESAVAGGRPVLVEKPLTLDLGRARALRRFVAERHGFVMVEHTLLFHPACRKLKELAPDLGPVRAIGAELGQRGPHRKDTPVLWDWGAHAVAFCLDLMGVPPEAAAAECLERRMAEDGRQENYLLRLIFSGDVSADIRVGNKMDRRRRFAVHFDTAVLVYDDLVAAKLTRHPPTADFADPEGTGEAIGVPRTPPLEVAVREFGQAIAGKSSDLASLDLGVAVVSVLADCGGNSSVPSHL